MKSQLQGWVTACISAATLAGCSSDINVREQWGAGLSKWGLRPLYPLRENVRLGDVYLYIENPCQNVEVSAVPQTMLLGAISEQAIQNAYDEFYGLRPALPRNARPGSSIASEKKTTTADNKVSVQMSGSATVTATSGATGSSTATASSGGAQDKVQDSPEADEKNPMFSSRRRTFNRLPMAALPDVKIYDYVGGTAGGAYGAISAAIAGEKSEKVTVSAQQVEMIELPAPAFLGLVDYYKSTPAWQHIKSNYGRLVRSLYDELAGARGCRVKPDSPKSLVMFVNSVYYTRSLSFEFGQDSAFAAKMAATLPTTAASALPANQFNPPSLPQGSGSGNPAQASAQALLSNLSTMSGGPGGGFTLAIGSSGNIALTQAFARPMAFATQHSIFEWPFDEASSGMAAPPTALTPAATQPEPGASAGGSGAPARPPSRTTAQPAQSTVGERAAPPGTYMPTMKKPPAGDR